MEPQNEFNVESFIEYTNLLKSKSKSLSALGFQPIRYPWRGKVSKLRAIVPSLSPQAVIEEALHSKKRNKKHKKTDEDVIEEETRNSAYWAINDSTPRVKYIWNQDGHRVVDDGRPTSPAPKKVIEVPPEPVFTGPKSSAVFEGKIIQKTDDFVKRQLEDMAREKAFVKVWAPLKYPGSTLPTKKGEQALPSKAIVNWPEYASLAKGDVLVTIEHCHSCASHKLNTHHVESHYIKMAQAVEATLSEVAARFMIKFAVVLKPVDLLSDPTAPERALEQDGTTFHQFKPRADVVDAVSTPLRTGAFEVQVAFNSTGHVATHLIHSKLMRGTWPKKRALEVKFKKILRTIAKFAPADSTTRAAAIQRVVEAPVVVESGACEADNHAHHKAICEPVKPDQVVAASIEAPGSSHAVSVIAPTSSSASATVTPATPAAAAAHASAPMIAPETAKAETKSELKPSTASVSVAHSTPNLLSQQQSEHARLGVHASEPVLLVRPPVADDRRSSQAAVTEVINSNIDVARLDSDNILQFQGLTVGGSVSVKSTGEGPMLSESFMDGQGADLGSLIFDGSLMSNHSQESGTLHNSGSVEAVGASLGSFLAAAHVSNAERRETISMLKLSSASREQRDADALMPSPVVFAASSSVSTDNNKAAADESMNYGEDFDEYSSPSKDRPSTRNDDGEEEEEGGGEGEGEGAEAEEFLAEDGLEDFEMLVARFGK